MAYENYSFVSWTDGTPLSSDRLGQMSTNIEQIKLANDDKPYGVLALKNVTGANTSGRTDFTEFEIISLKDESGTGGSDNTVTIDANRFYRVVVNFPGVVVKDAGGEDCRFILRIYSGLFGSGTELAEYSFTIPPYTFIDVASATKLITNHKLKAANARTTRVGAGKYEILLTTSASPLTAQSFYATFERLVGSSSNNATAFYIASDVTKLQLYVEDAGGRV